MNGLSEYEYAITMLMSRSKIPMHAKVEPEELICIDFADALRVATVTGRLKAIWGHIPNEGKRHALVALILKAMGLIPGSTDYYFIWEGGGGVIEIKTPARTRLNGLGKWVKVAAGVLGDNQQFFRTWCQEKRVRHAVCYSVQEGIDTLKLWGALLDKLSP